MSDNHVTPRPAPQPLCAVFAPLLPLLHSGELTVPEQAQVEAHLADCAWCQNQLTTFDIMDAALLRHYGPAFNERSEAALVDTSYRSGTRRNLTLEDIMKADQQQTRTTTVQQLRAPTRPQTARMPGIAALGAIAAVLLVAILAALIFALHGSPSHPVATHPTIPPGQGWTHAGPPWADWIVFAPSAPGTAYLCGTPGNTDPNRQAPVALALSQDSGRTWHSWTTSVRAGACVIDVDPTNAHDLLLEVAPCLIPGGASCPDQLFRSGDGGHSWRLVALPAAPAGSFSGPDVEEFQWAWQGSTLFVSPSPAGTEPQTLVAVSVAEGPFVWVNQTALLAGLPAGGQQINNLSANTVGVFVDFSGTSSPSTILTKVSTDQGATWSVFQPQYQGKKVQLVDQGVSFADGHTLMGEVVSGQNPNTGRYVTSTDGGATWTPMAAPPGDLVIAGGFLVTGLVSTPRGTYYAEMTSPNGEATAVPGVYRLAPGTSTWVLVGALPLTSGGPLAVSWDEEGHPLALWSIAQPPSSPPSSLAGLVTHTP